MRRMLTITAVLLLITGTALAQGNVHDEMAVGRADIQADRQKIVADNMHLTDAQSKTFWPVYREYRNELSKTGDRFVKLVSDYAQHMDTLTDEQAKSMTTEMMSIRKEQIKTTEKYIPKFEAVLPAKSVMRYLQIENKLDTIMMLAAADAIPLAK